MKLTYFRGDVPNFGDEINATMWAHLLPRGFLDEDAGELFLGAGSILWGHLPKQPRKFVAGSGYGAYSPPPDMHDGSWTTIWVRGPITAAHLKLDPSLAIVDAAVLLRETPLPAPDTSTGIAFMPHFESLERGNWKAACDRAGLTFLDPAADPMDTIAKMRGARLVIAEAMHGAIVADALRTPWIAVLPFHAAHQFKWQDWAASLDMPLSPRRLWPSTLLEGYTLATGKRGKGATSTRLFKGRAAAPANAVLTECAARWLTRIAERVEPQLSADAAIGRATDRAITALDGFVRRRQAA